MGDTHATITPEENILNRRELYVNTFPVQIRLNQCYLGLL